MKMRIPQNRATMTQKTPPKHFKFDYVTALHFYKRALDAAAKQGEAHLYKVISEIARQDLFFLLVFVLKRADINKEWLFLRCREVQLDPNDHLDLWAREHYKSTIITFGMTIFDIINDPEITIGIFSHTKSIARDFVRQIKFELESNEDLPKLWPDIFYVEPSRASPRWSVDGGIVVKRKGNPKEATVEGHGLVDGMPTGRHFKRRIYDDVVTMESVNTAEQINKTTEAWQMSDNLGAEGGDVRYIGTRYHLFDTYHVMIESGAVKPRIRPATHDGTITGRSVLMSEETLAKKRQTQGPYVFASQMLLNPTADTAMGFSRDWLKQSDIRPSQAMDSLWRFIIADPAGGKQRKDNDYTTFFVIGYGLDEKYRVLDIVRDRLRLTDRAQTLFDLHQQWKPSLVAYEEYGMQADIEHIKYVQQERLYEFDIYPLGGSMRKELRILRLVPLFEQGRIILPTTIIKHDHEGKARDLVQDFIEQEYVAFPVMKHDDMMDCLARLIDLEAADLIQKPSKQSPKGRSSKIEEGLRRLGEKGADSWLTA